MVVGQRKVVDEERADDDDRCGKGDAGEDTSTDDRLVFLPWGLAHHVVVDGVHAERLARRAFRAALAAVRQALLLHHSPSMRMLMNRICIALSGLLSPNIVLNVISVSAAAAVLSWKDRKFWMLWNIDLPVSHWVSTQ